MDEAGAQVASPVVIHQALAQRFCSPRPIVKKRSVPFYSSCYINQNPPDNWNPKSWDWDSSRFIARPLQCDGDQVKRGSQVPPDLLRNNEAQNSSLHPSEHNQIGKDDDNLLLKLGGGEQQATSNGSHGSMNLMEETHPVSRPSKRVRSGSPSTANRPMCQVDDCTEDLCTAKDYHRRHKVCEVHSKAGKALVGRQMQRFCQQCSRFHPLSEFDDGKRSCRRRLAGHNRRRRKTQPEDATPRVPVPSGSHNDINCEVDVINLLAALTRPQGNPEDRNAKVSSLPDKDQLVQILSKINSLPLPAIIAAKLPHLNSTSGSVSDHAHSENQNQMSANASSPSTMDLLAGLSGAPGVPSDALEIQSQPSKEKSEFEKSKSPDVDNAARLDTQKGSAGGEWSSTSCHNSPMEEVDCHVPETCPSLHLQLFSSSPEDNSSRKLPLNATYPSSNSSNPSQDISPTSSPPLVRDLFPMRTSRETMKCNHFINSEDELACAKSTMSNGCSTSLRLFSGSIQPPENASIQSSPYQAGYASSSGTDHSPPSLNSDSQDRTGRIIFKLFDKDPSHLPCSLRTQIFNWLSNSPSEMESFIRPGCIVLSLYLSMPLYAWDHIEENLFDCVSSLVKGADVSFWGNGRFLVCTERQMASHKDGKIRLYKTLKGFAMPELVSVSPVAVVSGQETSLVLRGRGLTIQGTKVHCTHADGYNIEEVCASMCQDAARDEIILSGFKIDGTSNMLGRCFVEVENSFRGTTFPVIIADKTICYELRLLEPHINGSAEVGGDHLESTERSWSREEVVRFLDELGWLFQRKRNSTLYEIPDYRLNRFKFLLIFTVEHDFCALVKTLLDILLELNLGRKGLVMESMTMLWEIHPLNRAVRRRCRRMIDLLIHYSVIDPDDASEKYIFTPNLAGPGGLTPLHLAASATSSEDLIDALISDPQEVGLQSWNSALDVNGLSPYAYALMRNNHSYNELVARKVAKMRNGEVCVPIENERNPLEVEEKGRCPRCAVAGYRLESKRYGGSQGLLQQPYIHSMLLVAAVCVCVCVFLRGHPYVGCVVPFAWENLDYGPR
ncbi:squamosa promoter-binding-like protein 14 [Salvia splendens]|uniref:squamosa promoter-binding-like protein 14 n=1 Tax=Salvia splendens TaxID=180675 RepID=UPI001C26209B|nr:squamosa promoter-binding-like protein 14 [Salvia splendens]